MHHGSLGTAATSTTWIRVSDVEAATRFYETVGPAAGFRVGTELADRTQFACISGFLGRRRRRPLGERPPCLAAADDETVDRFHRDATAAGYRDNGAPASARATTRAGYAAFVLDPDGNNVEVVNHNR